MMQELASRWEEDQALAAEMQAMAGAVEEEAQTAVETLERLVFSATSGHQGQLEEHIRLFLRAADDGDLIAAAHICATVTTAAALAGNHILTQVAVDLREILPMAASAGEISRAVELEFDPGLWTRIINRQ